MEYIVKPICLGQIEADQSWFTYMAFPGVPLVLDVAYFLIKGAPKKILVDTGSWADLMAKYWPGKGEDFQTFEAKGKITEDLVNPASAGENIARYIIRASFSHKRE